MKSVFRFNGCLVKAVSTIIAATVLLGLSTACSGTVDSVVPPAAPFEQEQKPDSTPDREPTPQTDPAVEQAKDQTAVEKPELDPAPEPDPDPDLAEEDIVDYIDGTVNGGGTVSQIGCWIYFRNMGDFDRLYRVRSDGFEKTRLSRDMSFEINVVGDWIYYSNYTEFALYKIHTDGSERTKLCDDWAMHISIADDWIYYHNYYDDGKLYRIKTDGTGREKINNDECWYIAVVGDWVYYQNQSDNLRPYRIRVDGSERTKLNNDAIDGLVVCDDWIYYQRIDDTKLYKAHTDGSDRTKLNDDGSYFILVDEGWVYYYNYDDGGSIYKIRTDGSDRTKLNNEESGPLSIVGDWLYYRKGADRDNLYRMRRDGTEQQLFSGTSPSYTDDCFYGEPQEYDDGTPDSIDKLLTNISWNGAAIEFTALREVIISGISVIIDGQEHEATEITNLSGNMGIPNGATAWAGSRLNFRSTSVILFEGTTVRCELDIDEGQAEYMLVYLSGGESYEWNF